ncbi:MAG TPA: hypothetical protein VMB23_02050 [Spirochaetia bacterium]|nr:hypothetical protein [Spirochaetia bacterium]
MPSKLLFAVLLVAVAAGLPALEVQRGKLKLVINDRTGRYTVWGAEDQVKPVWTPLFLAEDPTTSKWKLQVADKTLVLGDDPSFTTATEATQTGAKVTWTSKTLVVTLTFDFLLSASSAVADGLKLDLVAVNVADSTVRLGVRWLLDTNLGEKKDHFKLSTGDVVNSETKLEGNFPDFWASNSPTDDQLGLLVMAGKVSTVPLRIVFSNWKRLDDAPWDPIFKQGRDFNLLPYSFNDSAVAQLYETQDLAAGASREIVVALGLKSAGTLVGSRVGSANPLDDLLKKNQNPALGAVDQDLASLDTLMAQLDAKLADPARVTPEDLKLVQAVLDQIDARRKTLEASKP